MEKRSKELEGRVGELERECEALRRENGWLKGLVVGVTGASVTGAAGGVGGNGTGTPGSVGVGVNVGMGSGSATGLGTAGKRKREEGTETIASTKKDTTTSS